MTYAKTYTFTEIVRDYPTAWINKAYSDILHRNPRTADIDYWKNDIVGKGWSETTLRDTIRKAAKENGETTYA